MNVVICHNFAHRLRNDGLLESAPARSGEVVGIGSMEGGFGGSAGEQVVYIENDKWGIRNIEDMDLTGGDWALIRDTLMRFRDVFSLSGRRTPAPPVQQKETAPEASAVA